ncbi:MAG: PA1571 family protein [Pseudomonas sp.]
MNLNDNRSTPRPARQAQQQTVGGAIIDAQGREVPITELMIQQACRELEKNYPQTAQRG